MFTQRGLQIWLIVLSGICHHLWCKLLPFAGYIWVCLLLESLKSPNHWWVEGVWLSLCCSNSWISVFLLVAHFFLQSAWWFVLFLWPFSYWLLQFYSLISLFFPLEAGRESEWNFLPQNQCLKKRPAAFSLKPGDGSSITPLHLQDPFPPLVGQKGTERLNSIHGVEN